MLMKKCSYCGKDHPDDALVCSVDGQPLEAVIPPQAGSSLTPAGHMEKPRRPIPWLSGSLATLVALFIVGAILPNTGRVVVDHAFSPPRIYVQPQPWAVCGILALTFLPVLCIFILGRRWIFFDWLGWIVLAFLLSSMFSA